MRLTFYMPCHSDPAPCPANEESQGIFMFNHERRGKNVILRSFVSRARCRLRNENDSSSGRNHNPGSHGITIRGYRDSGVTGDYSGATGV